MALIAFLALGCGRKAPPVWLKPDELPAPTYISAYYRDSGVSISWDYPPGLLRYVKYFAVERRDDAGFVEFFNSLEPEFSDPSGGGYAYRVAAVGGAKGVKGKYSSIVESLDSDGLAPPAGLKAVAHDEGVKLTWRSDVKEVRFNLYKSVDHATRTDEKPINPVPVKGHMYIDKRFDPSGGSVSYLLRAVRTASTEGASSVAEGPASEPLLVWGEIFMPKAPAGVDITSSGGKVLVYWNENTEKWLSGYRIYRSREGGGFELLGKTRTPAFKDVPATAGKYSYRVHALGPSGIQGPPSKTVQVNLLDGKK